MSLVEPGPGRALCRIWTRSRRNRSDRSASLRPPKSRARAARFIAMPPRRCPARDRAAPTFMLVGEQPGDKEDFAGKPFVGPAGRVLDQALHDAGIAREQTFVTNAVKHFKHEMRGKRRLHKRPNSYEIERCKIWLDDERRLVKPSAIIALGVTAARSLTGKALTISKVRGKTTRARRRHEAVRHRASVGAVAHRGRERQAQGLSAIRRRSEKGRRRSPRPLERIAASAGSAALRRSASRSARRAPRSLRRLPCRSPRR